MDKKSFGQTVRQNIIVGMLSFLPIWLTLSLLVFILSFISGQVDPLMDKLIATVGLSDNGLLFLSEASILRTAIAFILVLVIFYFWGLLAKRWLGVKAIQFVDSIMDRIPVAKPIYRAAKGMMTSIQGNDKLSKKVVFVDYPMPGIRAVAFLTKTYFEPKLKEEVAVVFIPMGPAPTTGYVHIVSKHLVTETDWSVEDALSFIISGGTKIPVSESTEPEK